MRTLCTLMAVLMLAAPLIADEKEKGEDPNAKAKSEREKRNEEKRKERDSRTKMELPISRLTAKNAEKVTDALKAMGAIDEAALDQAKAIVEVTFASNAECSLSRLRAALKPCAADIDLKKLKLKLPCVVALKGEIDGWKFDRSKGRRKRSFQYTRGQKLLSAFKELEGVRSFKYLDGKRFQLGMDRDVPYATIAALVAEHGSRSDGSSFIDDISWRAEKQMFKQPGERPEKGGEKGDKGDKGGEEGGDKGRREGLK